MRGLYSIECKQRIDAVKKLSLSTVGTVAFTALGYWLFGQIASVYAIPPGFASPIWPAAGFAVLMVLVFGRISVIGVFIGSLLLNLAIAQQNNSPALQAWLLSSLIATGATTQALFAHFLVGRFTRYPQLISAAWDAMVFGLLIGPIACVVSATMGVSALIAVGAVSAQDGLFNALNWWVGDSVGAMLFAPIIMTFNMRMHRGNTAHTVGFLVFYGLTTCLATAVFLHAKNQDQAHIASVLAERTKGYFTAVSKQLDSAADTAQSVVAVFESFDQVDYDNFMRFSESLYSHIPGTQALSWIPVVPADERQVYESQLSSLHGLTPYFFEKDDAQQNIPAETKAIYFPVYFIYPLVGNTAAIGFDLSSHPGRKRALQHAMASGQQVATEPIELVQEKATQKAILLFSPITQGGEVEGFVSMVYRINDLVVAALNTDVLERYAVTILDVTEHEAQPLIEADCDQQALVFSYLLGFAQRQWQITFQPRASEVEELHAWWLWFILIFAFVFVTLLGLLILMILSRTAAIEREVEIKTIALSDALAHAKHASEVKTAFLASMSHELRTPLNAIIGFSHRLRKRLRDELDERYVASLEVIHRSGNSLLTMINDILDLSTLESSQANITREMVDINMLASEVVIAVSPLAEEAGIDVKLQANSVASLAVDRLRFSQILASLTRSAIELCAPGGSVTLSFHERTRVGQKGVELQVCNTGVEVSADALSKFFVHYEQLGDTFQGGEMGLGLRLALVKKLVELHGGTVAAESATGEGCTFYAWFPHAEPT